jgi:hypothetical protein
MKSGIPNSQNLSEGIWVMKSIIAGFPARRNMNAIIVGKSEKMKAASTKINLINVFII